MFSQLRNAVESLAQQQLPQLPQPSPRRAGRAGTVSQDATSERAEYSRSGSLDLQNSGKSIGLSTGQLAESALSNLKKSFATQRSGSPLQSTEKGPAGDKEPRQVPKSRLEDRLRATFAIGDASAATTPEAGSSRASPTPPPISRDPINPTSVPLPLSPVRSPSPKRETFSAISPNLASDPLNAMMVPKGEADTQQTVNDAGRYSEADVPLPPTSPPPPATQEQQNPFIESKHGNVNADRKETSRAPSENGGADLVEPSTVASAVSAELAPASFTTSPSEDKKSPFDSVESEVIDAPPNQNETVPEPSLSPQGPGATTELLEATSQTHLVIESLQNKLKVLEQRFADVSTSYKQLQADKEAADRVLSELTPVQAVTDTNALAEHLRSVRRKDETTQSELQRLNGKIRSYDDRIEELRDVHRLESRSQSEQVDKVRKQVEEAEALLKSANDATVRAQEESNKCKVEIDRLHGEVDKSKGLAKEEEEKRVKAISLLKTVRQKLVKAEKERDDAVREADTSKEKEKLEREKERAERARLEEQVDAARAEKERDIAGLKSHFDRELASIKERLEKEHAARKGHLELEAITTKAMHQKELERSSSRISTLENSVRSLSNEKNHLFDQLQMRQAELESSQTHLESLQNGTTELQFQLREATERISLLTEELGEARRWQESPALRPSNSAEETSRMVAAVEAKYEAKITELNSRLAAIERERNETETALSRNLRQKVQEAESLRRVAESAAQVKAEADSAISNLKQEAERLSQEAAIYQKQVHEFQQDRERVKALEVASQMRIEDSSLRAEELEAQIQDLKGREAQLRASNKSLREELRKVQTSAALLERQRNPGVGYWSTFSRANNSSDVRPSSPSSTDLTSEAGSPRSGSPAPAKADEEVNLEYLRNVILQFLEHKEMRPHLVKVLSIILHFTPQETRRLVAKV